MSYMIGNYGTEGTVNSCIFTNITHLRCSLFLVGLVKTHFKIQSSSCGHFPEKNSVWNICHVIQGESEWTFPSNLLINGKLRMLWSWNLFYLKEEHFHGNIVS